MEQVSDVFKKAIKATEREIKGYVEVIYDNQSNESYNITEIPEQIEYGNQSEIIDGIRKVKNYASLEPDRTLLDGTFILPNSNVVGDNVGYVSNQVFSDIENKIITIESDTPVTSSGITIYFQDNIAKDFNIKINDNVTFIESGNTHRVYNKIFDNPIQINKLSIEFVSMEHEDWRIRIPEIDLGISQVYEGEDLVSFNTDEEIDLMMEQTPTNTCSVNLSNYENQFDPINPTGLVKYLTDNTIIKPFCGIVTDNGIEYVCLGYYYVKDWSSDVNGNATVNGQSLMGKLSNEQIKSNGEFFDNKPWYSYDLSQYLTEMYGYKFNLDIGTIFHTDMKSYKLLEYLQALSSFMTQVEYPRKFYNSRTNEVKLDLLENYVVDTLTKTELTEDVKYETKSIVNKVSIKAINDYLLYSTGEEDVLNQQYTLVSNEEYIYFNFNKYVDPYNYQYNFSYESTSGGKAELVDVNKHLAYIKFTGQIGETITVHYSGYVYDDPPIYESTFTNEKNNGDKLELDFSNYFVLSSNEIKKTADFYLTNDKKYKITGKYNGNPALLTGDTVSVETKFGMKDVILTKLKLTFDGGLSGSFEGVGNDE